MTGYSSLLFPDPNHVLGSTHLPHLLKGGGKEKEESKVKREVIANEGGCIKRDLGETQIRGLSRREI